MLQASAILKGMAVRIEPEFEQKLQELIDACQAHLPSVDEAMIRQAFRLSYWAHRNDRRASGELYITHPLAVAMIVAKDISFDDVSVGAALLHDVVEDTECSLDLIREEFGETMAMLIDGLTKISGVFSSRELGLIPNQPDLV